MFALWWYKGRDPDPGMSVAPMYEPPPGISPAEAGTLLDDRIHPRDITSTIVDLAVRGFIKIEETDDKGLLFHHKDYIFHLLQKRQDWRGLAPHERVMMENIFAGDAPDTRLSSLKNRFYRGGARGPHRYYVGAEAEGNLRARSRIGQWLQRRRPRSAFWRPSPFSSSWAGPTFSVRSGLLLCPADLCRDLVALCPADDGEDYEGSRRLTSPCLAFRNS